MQQFWTCFSNPEFMGQQQFSMKDFSNWIYRYENHLVSSLFISCHRPLCALYTHRHYCIPGIIHNIQITSLNLYTEQSNYPPPFGSLFLTLLLCCHMLPTNLPQTVYRAAIYTAYQSNKVREQAVTLPIPAKTNTQIQACTNTWYCGLWHLLFPLAGDSQMNKT